MPLEEIVASLVPAQIWHLFFYFPLLILAPFVAFLEFAAAFVGSRLPARLDSAACSLQKRLGPPPPHDAALRLLATLVTEGCLVPTARLLQRTVAFIRSSDCNALGTMELRYLLAGSPSKLTVDVAEREVGRAFIDSFSRFWLDCIRCSGASEVILSARHGSSAAAYCGRVHWLDSEITRLTTQEGVRQWIILGAGYDTRAWRMNELRREKGVNVIEVDVEQVQCRKLRKLREHFSPEELENRLFDVAFVGHSLTEDESALAAKIAHKVESKKTLVLLEGVTWYISMQTFAAMVRSLQKLRQLTRSNMSLLFDAATTEYVKECRALPATDRDRFMLNLSIGLNPLTFSRADDAAKLREELAAVHIKSLDRCWKSADFVRDFHTEGFHFKPLEFQIFTTTV